MEIKTRKRKFYLMAIFPTGKQASFRISQNGNNIVFAKPSLLSEWEKQMVYKAWQERKAQEEEEKEEEFPYDYGGALINAINAFYAGAVDKVFGYNGEVLLSRY